MVIQIAQLLEFYDSKNDTNRELVTAVNAVAGEEFGLALMVHFFRGKKRKPELDPTTPITGNLRGPRLDGWIKLSQPDELFQVEVKNWAAHSKAGVAFPANKSPENLEDYRKRMWKMTWDNSLKRFHSDRVQKVVVPMVRPEKWQEFQPKPAACLWTAMHHAGESIPWFSVDGAGIDGAGKKQLSPVWIFSMSNYLRGLNEERVELCLPKTRRVLIKLGNLFPPYESVL